MTKKIPSDSEVVAEGQQVITACALIHQKFDGIEKVFLPKRASTKKFLPSVFEIPGGHIDYAETLVEGLKREIQEELGMNVEVGEPFAAFTYLNNIKKTHSVEIVYFASFTDPVDSIKLNPEDHSEYVWISQKEIHKVYTDNKGENDDEFIILRRAFELLC